MQAGYHDGSRSWGQESSGRVTEIQIRTWEPLEAGLADLGDSSPKCLGIRVAHINMGFRHMWTDQPPRDRHPFSLCSGYSWKALG